MNWPNIPADVALTRLKLGARGLDVRSPKEFSRSAIPGFENVPILNDEHRHLVGLCYKQNGQDAAVALGMNLVSPRRDDLLARWRASLERVAPDQRLLICWRGGLRSGRAAEWLSADGVEGVRVEGGYKSMRGALRSTFEHLPPLVILSGSTGVGKTELLWRLPKEGIVDLEAAASHRGSAFGGRLAAAQPTQQTFENRIGMQLWGYDGVRIVESESATIGSCVVPSTLRAAMASAPIVILEDSFENRVRRIFLEYVAEPMRSHPRSVVFLSLQESLSRIGRRLGGVRYDQIAELLGEAFRQPENSAESHTPWIESLLREYYDPRYAHSLNHQARNVLFRGDGSAVLDFLTSYLNRRRA